ncbi:protein FATTY ACID EXPORT 3, chloroplastic-like [Mangifera indica]|uniref:protein FATTY ACID EXPORT 3, chloroplastic-like n=1 Tax=Mangifera indica TaxID=29780 RepID=UPI001CF9757D|nr:protein FATTY ACID EXPORT 3, chloroplastic-like [Mangifera indica]XP_044496559.1 protein FATTY ACID EXPORT 3, chloroplastic-like [Mangifera indica]
MSVSVELLSIKNPNPRISFSNGVVKRALCTSPSLQFDSRGCRVSLFIANGLGVGSCLRLPRSSINRTFVVSAASHEESASEIEIEKNGEDLKASVEESNEAWKQALESFKEQALKLQSVSQEAYEIYSKKALIILQETSEQLKIQAEKARQELTVVAKELSEEGKEYLTTAAEKSPEVKEIVVTFTSSTDELKDVTKIRDFHVGIPYGLLLSLGGFLSFMLTGSTSAIRFGLILGGALLALSISSLRSQNKGETFPLALKGQAAIATIIFLRELRIFSQRFTFPASVTTLISGAVVAFYAYKIIIDGQWRKGSGSESGAEN